jgi:hypothetical protein
LQEEVSNRFAAERHKRKGNTGSAFAGCSARSPVRFPCDMKLNRKKIMADTLKARVPQLQSTIGDIRHPN